MATLLLVSTFADMANKIIDLFGAFTYLSPSGTRFHCLIR